VYYNTLDQYKYNVVVGLGLPLITRFIIVIDSQP
jgi:hypothetical protein